MSNKNNSRPIAKLATAPGFVGDSERRSGVYSNVYEDSSTESTHKSPAEVELPEKPNIQDLLKIIAIIAMIIDHIGLFFVPSLNFRMIGRIAMPIFLFFVGYNYYKTKKSKKLLFSLEEDRYKNILLLGIMLQLLLYINLPNSSLRPILISISLSVIILDFIENFRINIYVSFFMLILLIPFSLSLFGYGTLGTIFGLIGFYIRKFSEEKTIYRTNLNCLLFIAYFISWVFSYIKFNFSIYQDALVALLYFVSFLALTKFKFEKILDYKFLLTSRYLLQIYFWHFTLFAIISGINNLL